MSEKEYSRRKFLKNSTLTGLGVGLTIGMTQNLFGSYLKDTGTAAILGGQPVHTRGWLDWPMWDPETDEKRVIEVLRSGIWPRGKVISEFEEKWAETIGSKRCLVWSEYVAGIKIRYE
jgi:perosamine synthetase